jgi:hypothetical protein
VVDCTKPLCTPLVRSSNGPTAICACTVLDAPGNSLADVEIPVEKEKDDEANTYGHTHEDVYHVSPILQTISQPVLTEQDSHLSVLSCAAITSPKILVPGFSADMLMSLLNAIAMRPMRGTLLYRSIRQLSGSRRRVCNSPIHKGPRGLFIKDTYPRQAKDIVPVI